MTGVQFSLDGESPDPRSLVGLSILERAALYARLGLAPMEREAVEAAVRKIIAADRRGAS